MEDAFVYSTSPENFTNTLLALYDKALEDIAKIPDLEPLILSDLYKSQKNKFVKAPQKPKEEPVPRSNEGEKSV